VLQQQQRWSADLVIAPTLVGFEQHRMWAHQRCSNVTDNAVAQRLATWIRRPRPATTVAATAATDASAE
jgi:hypothetical protein